MPKPQLIITCAMLIVLYGCSSVGQHMGDGHPDGRYQPAVALQTSPLDVMSSLEHKSTSLVFERCEETLLPDSMNRVRIVNGAAWFIPYWESSADESSNLAYAVYRFVVSERAQLNLQMDWLEAPADLSNLWVGLANWNESRWDWFIGQADGGINLGSSGYVDYVKPDTGEVLVTIMLLGKEQAGLNRVSIALNERGAWPEFAHDPQNTGLSEHIGAQTSDLKWVFQTNGDGGTFQEAALGPDGVVCFGGGPELYALNPDGTLKWQTNLNCRPTTRPVFDADGGVYFGADQGLYALNRDGSLAWFYATPGPVENNPAIDAQGSIYFACYGSWFYSMNPDGELNWVRQDEEHITLKWSDAVIGDDGSIYATRLSELYAFSPDGTLRWQQPLISSYQDPPVIGINGEILVTTRSALQAYGNDGGLLWEWDYDGEMSFGGRGLAVTQSGSILVYARQIIYELSPAGELIQQRMFMYLNHDSLSLRLDGSFLASGSTNQKELYSFDSNLEVPWKVITAGSIDYKPAVASDGTAYFGSTDDKFYCIGPAGAVRWVYRIGAPVRSSPVTAHDGTVYFGANDNRLYALDQAGNQKWFFETGDDITGTPAIGQDGTVYFGSCDHQIYAVDRNGLLIWSYDTDRAVTSSPAIGDDGMVYVGNYDGNLYAFDPDDGIEWVAESLGWVGSPAVGHDGTIYVSTDYHRKLHSISPTGVVNWEYAPSYQRVGDPMVGPEGMVFWFHEHLYRVNQEGLGGMEYFRAAIPPGVHQTPSVSPDGWIRVGVDDDDGAGAFLSIHPWGHLDWEFATEGAITSTAAIGSDGTAYFGSRSGLVYAVDDSGSEVWQFKTGGEVISSPAIGADGTVYVGSDDGRLYAFGP